MIIYDLTPLHAPHYAMSDKPYLDPREQPVSSSGPAASVPSHLFRDGGGASAARARQAQRTERATWLEQIYLEGAMPVFDRLFLELHLDDAGMLNALALVSPQAYARAALLLSEKRR